MISKSLETYLKNIYVLKEQNDEIRVTDIANKMNCSKPSVNKAINNLRDNNLINYETYGKIELTEKGEQLAKKILNNYNIVFVFLKDILKLDIDEAKKEAEKIKSVISDDTIIKLNNYIDINSSFKDNNYKNNNSKEKCKICSRKFLQGHVSSK